MPLDFYAEILDLCSINTQNSIQVQYGGSLCSKKVAGLILTQASLCGVCISHAPKICTLGQLAALNRRESVC